MSYDLEYGEFRDKPLAWLRDNEPDYNDATYLVKRWPEVFDFVNYVSYNEDQYVGGPSDKANYEYWRENYEKTENKTWWDLGSGNGILVRIPLLTKDERESYDYLEGEGYELDEDGAQKIRNELEMEAWDDFGRKEYKDAILEGISDDKEKEVVEELLDAITDGGFDAAAFDMWSRASGYPEVSGWEVTFPDAANMLQRDENFTGYTVEGVINWLGIGHEVTLRLSPRAFCRLHPDDKGFGYPGAMYIRYGEEWILNVNAKEIINASPTMESGRGAPYDYAAIDKLIALHLDESEKYIGFDQAPTATAMFNSQMCRNPYLTCDIDYIEKSKLAILRGPEPVWDAELAEKEGEDAAKKKYNEDLEASNAFSAMVQKVRNIAIDGALEVCDIDPAPDLVERVVEQLILDAPERDANTLDFPSTRDHLKQSACDYTRKFLDQRPSECTLRQLKLKLDLPHHIAKRIRQKGKKRA